MQTNYDFIKEKTENIDKLAEFLNSINFREHCDNISQAECLKIGGSCPQCIKIWLGKENDKNQHNG